MKRKAGMRKSGMVVKCGGLIGGMVLVLLAVMAGPALGAIDFEVFCKQGSLMGYINQGAQFGIAGDEFDTKQGFQSAVFQFLLEMQLDLSTELKFFGSVGCNADWAYPMLTSNDEWDDKDFDDARDELFIYSHWQDISA